MWAHLQDYLQANRRVRNVLKKKRFMLFRSVDTICGSEFLFTAKRDIRFFFSPTTVKNLPSSVQEACPEFFIFSPSGIFVDDSLVGSSREFLARIRWPSVAFGVTGPSLFAYGSLAEVLSLESFLTSRLRLLRFYIYNRSRRRRYIFNHYVRISSSRSFFGLWFSRNLFYSTLFVYFKLCQIFLYLLHFKV